MFIAKAYLPFLLGDKKQTENIPLGIKNRAQFANIAYQKDSPSHIQGYGEFLPKYSTDDFRVYKNDNDKRINMSISGTRLNNFNDAKRDLTSDLFGVVLGQKDEDPRFWEANRTIQTLKKTYPDYKINISAHSLGGTIAKDIAQKNPDVQAVVFNPGSSPFVSEPKLKNVIEFRKSGDVISSFSNPHNTGGDFYSLPFSGHSLKNFT